MEKRFRKIYVEIGNVCNLQCSFCPEVERRNARLSENEFRGILEQVKALADCVTFHVMGEPMAHPEFTRFVEVAGEVGVPVEITTNGTLLRGEKLEALLHPIVRQVNFSLQSFVDNYPERPIEDYLAPIFAFCRRAFAERPELYLNLRLWNLKKGAKTDAVNERILAQVEQEFGVTVNRNVDARLRKSKRLVHRLYLHYDTRFRWPNGADPERRTAGTCYGTRSHIAIHVDGTVVPCCLDKEAAIPLGHLASEPLAEIVAGARIENMRQGFERGELVESLCRRCEYATRFGGGDPVIESSV